MGFKHSANKPTIYRKKQRDTGILLLCLYVDDIVYMDSSEEMLREFKEEMMKTFEMLDLGQLKYILELKVNQLSDSLFVSQHKYTVDLLNKSGMKNCKPIGIPMNSNEQLHSQDNSGSACSTRCRSIVGGLLYLTHT